MAAFGFGTWTITFVYIDEKGKKSSTSVNVPDALALDKLIIYAQQLAKLIDPLLRGKLVSISVALTIDLPTSGITTTPLSNSDVEEKGYFQFLTDGGHYTAVNLPTLDENKVLAGTDALDTADPAVDAFITAMIDGIDLSTATPVAGTGIVQAQDSRGEDIVGLSIAREVFQSSGARRT